MTAWHVNEGLAPLIAEMKATYHGIVIGTIGDAAHQHEHSDHNPNAAGRVNAADFMLGTSFTENDAIHVIPWLVTDSRTKYLIHDRKIWQNGAWTTYVGNDPHTNHIHLSVFDIAYKNTKPWGIASRKVEMINFEVSMPILHEGDRDDQ